MDPLTAFLLGFGACLLIWLTAEVSWPRRRELEATPEEEFGLDPKKNSAVSIANRVFISRRKSPYGFTCPQTNGVSPRLSSAVIRSAQADSLSTRWIISVLM